MINIYDNIIQQATIEHMPGNDWRLIKAQLYIESGLKDHIIKKTGERGIAKLNKQAWELAAEELGFPSIATRETPRFAIPALCFLMADSWQYLEEFEENIDRYCLALTIYKTGKIPVFHAKTRSGTRIYSEILQHLPGLIGVEKANKVKNYVHNIITIWTSLVLGPRPADPCEINQ